MPETLNTLPQWPQALRMPEAMRITALSRASLYRAMADGRLRSVKIGKCRLFLMSDLEAFLKEGRDDR